MWRAAERVRINHGLAEEVVRDHPDLVIAGSYSTPATRALLLKLHYPLLVLEPADSFEAIRRQVRTVASALSETERGRALIAHMDAALIRLHAERGPPLRVAAWDGAGFSAAPGTLYDTLLKAAGARNVTAQTQGRNGSTPEVEKLIATAPQLLVAGAPAFQRPALQTDVARHPLVRRYWSDRTLTVPLSAYQCRDAILGRRGAVASRPDARKACPGEDAPAVRADGGAVRLALLIALVAAVGLTAADVASRRRGGLLSGPGDPGPSGPPPEPDDNGAR